jgi:hypothetical protein
MQIDRLTFGLKRPDGSRITSADWQAFERDTLAPAFPEGFTLWTAEGAWRDATTGATIREPSAIVEIAHNGSKAALIESVAAAYAAQFDQDAVMHENRRALVSFIGKPAAAIAA